MALTRRDLASILASRPTSAILAATPGYTSQQFENLPVGTPVSPSFYDTLPARTQMPSVAAQYGLGAARQRLNPAMMLARRQERERQAMGGLPSITSPAGQALGAAATTGLQLSGWQDRPITLGQGLGAMAQAGMEAYTAAKQAEGLSALKEREIAVKEASALAKLGGPFQGTSSFAQTGNIIFNLAPKIKSGTATEQEKALYAMAYSSAIKPQRQVTFDEEGNQIITEIPGQDLPQEMFPRPEGLRDPLKTVKPGTEQIKQSFKLKDSLKMLQNLNAYRETLRNPEFTVSSQIGGALGFPGELAAQASAQAEALRLDLKNLYELGALVGGDFQILDRLLTSPNTREAIQGGRDFLLAQLDQLERQLELDMGQKDVQLSGTLAMPIVAATKEDWDNAPNYVYVRLPDGRVVYKDPRVQE